MVATAVGLGLTAAAALGSSGIGAMNSKRQYHWQRDLTNLQYDLNQRALRESPSATRAGLEAAGYNPILGVQGATNAPSVGLGAAGSAGSPDMDFSSGVTNAYRAFKLEKQKTDAEVNATNAGASLASEQAKTEEFKRMMYFTQSGLNEANKLLTDKHSSNIDKDYATRWKSQLMQAQSGMISAMAAQSQAHTAKRVGEANEYYQYENARHQRIWNEFYDGHPIRQFSNQFFGKANPAFIIKK